MSKHCQVLGTRAHVGNAVSHSHRKTRRTFSPNLQRKRYYVPSLGRTVTLTLTPKGMKTIDRQGIEAVAARLIESGEIGQQPYGKDHGNQTGYHPAIHGRHWIHLHHHQKPS